MKLFKIYLSCIFYSTGLTALAYALIAGSQELPPLAYALQARSYLALDLVIYCSVFLLEIKQARKTKNLPLLIFLIPVILTASLGYYFFVISAWYSNDPFYVMLLAKPFFITKIAIAFIVCSLQAVLLIRNKRAENLNA